MMWTNQCQRLALVWLLMAVVAVPLVPAEEPSDEKPICTIAAVSSPYITTLSAEELGERSWIAAIAPAGLKKSLAAVAALKPDALVVLGSLTWAGSDADFERLASFLADVKVPLYLVPGPRDVADGGRERFLKRFAKQNVARKSVNVKGVHLQFATNASATDGEDPNTLIDWMEADLATAADARAVLVFDGPEYRAPNDTTRPGSPQGRYWSLVEKHKVAARLVPGHSHSVGYVETLPIWSIPSSGWSYSPKWTVALVTVYPRRIELKLILGSGQPAQTLVVPNPVSADRMPTAVSDPFGVPTYSEDLARQPQLTFAQLSDSQFDDDTVPRYASRFRYDEQMNELAVTQVNRLNPALVFMTGDLTNKNTEAEWKTFDRIYSKLKPPFYALPGNHDILFDRTKLDPESLGDLLATGQKNWKLADTLAGGKATDRAALYRHFIRREPYFAVEKKGCVFLCLNTWTGYVDDEQVAWLRKELERTRSAPHVFVLGHYPLLKEYGGNVTGPGAEQILRLLREYRVAAYLSGHRHRYNYRMHEGTAHVLCDCLCWGEYLSYQVYHVFPDRIVACWKPIFRAEGNRPLYERVVFPEPRYRGAQ